MSATHPGVGGNCLYSDKDVRKIWDGFFDLNYKYWCGILAKIINMDLKFVIFGLQNIDLWVLNLATIINMGL